MRRRLLLALLCAALIVAGCLGLFELYLSNRICFGLHVWGIPLGGMRVEEVRIITPADYRLRLRRPADERSVVVHVLPEATLGERYWCDRVSAGDRPPPWADLRWDDRVVVGGLG